MSAYERIAPEQYDSLPDVPEPSESVRLRGHHDIAGTILSAYRSGRLHHGLLLHGPRGIGKATFAFRFAHHLLRHPRAAASPTDLDPGEPGSALHRQIATGAHASVLHLTRPQDREGGKFRTAITVDEIRRVGNLLQHTAHDGGHRVVIVDSADDMNANAANALLKNLEEPPGHCVFLLISHQPGALLSTIRSRCQAYRFHPLGDEDVLAVLESVGEPLPKDAETRRALLAQAAGSPRNAILMSRYGGLDIVATIEAILTGSAFDVATAHRLAEAVSARGSEVQFSLLNDALLERIAAGARRAGAAGDIVGSGRLAELWRRVNEAIRRTEIYNLDRRQHVVGTLMRMHEATGG
jgi:DNA polymerase-3 subunit delta'